MKSSPIAEFTTGHTKLGRPTLTPTQRWINSANALIFDTGQIKKELLKLSKKDPDLMKHIKMMAPYYRKFADEIERFIGAAKPAARKKK